MLFDDSLALVPPFPSWPPSLPPSLPPPAPAQVLWPSRSRPEFVVDCWRVMLADPEGNIIGFDTDWGRGGPLARVAYAERNGTRDF